LAAPYLFERAKAGRRRNLDAICQETKLAIIARLLRRSGGQAGKPFDRTAFQYKDTSGNAVAFGRRCPDVFPGDGKNAITDFFGKLLRLCSKHDGAETGFNIRTAVTENNDQ
jgi:hypothetical protein